MLLAAIEPLWKHLTGLLCVFGGWDASAVLVGRPRASGAPARTRVSRAVDTGSGVLRPWEAFTVLVHLRNWQELRDIDQGFVDVYFMPESDPQQVTSSGTGHTPLVASAVTDRKTFMATLMQAVARYRS